MLNSHIETDLNKLTPLPIGVFDAVAIPNGITITDRNRDMYDARVIARLRPDIARILELRDDQAVSARLPILREIDLASNVPPRDAPLHDITAVIEKIRQANLVIEKPAITENVVCLTNVGNPEEGPMEIFTTTQTEIGEYTVTFYITGYDSKPPSNPNYVKTVPDTRTDDDDETLVDDALITMGRIEGIQMRVTNPPPKPEIRYIHIVKNSKALPPVDMAAVIHLPTTTLDSSFRETTRFRSAVRSLELEIELDPSRLSSELTDTGDITVDLNISTANLDLSTEGCNDPNDRRQKWLNEAIKTAIIGHLMERGIFDQARDKYIDQQFSAASEFPFPSGFLKRFISRGKISEDEIRQFMEEGPLVKNRFFHMSAPKRMDTSNPHYILIRDGKVLLRVKKQKEDLSLGFLIGAKSDEIKVKGDGWSRIQPDLRTSQLTITDDGRICFSGTIPTNPIEKVDIGTVRIDGKKLFAPNRFLLGK